MNPVFLRRARPVSTPWKRFVLPGMPALAVLAMLLLPAVSAVAGTVHVSAAASLTEAVIDLARANRAAHFPFRPPISLESRKDTRRYRRCMSTS